MSLLETKLEQIPDYAKDIKINLKNLLNNDHSTLTKNELHIIFLASACATRNKLLIEMFEERAKEILSEEEINAAKAAATIMAMNNIYYRFVHLSSNHEYQSMAPGLRMSIIKQHKISDIAFELASLAVSALNGCGLCIDSHEKHLKAAGVTKEQIIETIKISAVTNAFATCFI